MQDQTQETLRTIRKLKHTESAQERLQGWRSVSAARGLNGKAYTEEEADMVAALFGR